MPQNECPESVERSPVSISEPSSHSQTQTDSSSPLPPSSSPSSPARSPLTPGERAMVDYLRDHFGVHGAVHYVRRYGVDVWKAVISDYEALPDSEKVRNPAGLLVWLTRDLSGVGDE